MPAEDFLFSAGGGFLFGTVAGYAIKKAMKIVTDNPIDNLFFGDYNE
ncbi:MAG: hypothetical protein WAK17_12175 [Candidatus Nitrosopolaris sp.]